MAKIRSYFVLYLWPMLFVLPFISNAQNLTKKKITYGANIGIESSNLAWFGSWQQGQTFPRIWDKKSSVGVSLGGFAQYPLTKTIVIRSGLNATSTASTIYFQREDVALYAQKYHFNEVEMPIHFVLTNRKGSFPLRGSMILGGRLGWNFANAPKSHNLYLYHNRTGFDAGLGVEINLKKLRLQPEFLYSFCINNQNDATKTDTYWGVGRTVRDRMTFHLVFMKPNK
jgi:hypothetical protein